MRTLGVDFGRSRTGLALSDPHGLTCSPLEVLQERNEDRLLQKIVRTAEEHEVARIVVGLPRPLAGGTNPQCEEVLTFVEKLGGRSPVPVTTWDERFTSKLARKWKDQESSAGLRGRLLHVAELLGLSSESEEEHMSYPSQPPSVAVAERARR